MKKISDSFGYYILTFLASLPLSALYVLSDFMSVFVHRIIRYRLKVVRTKSAQLFSGKIGQRA